MGGLPVKRGESVPHRFAIVVSCSPAKVLRRLARDRETDLVKAMPRARERRPLFLLFEEEGGFRLVKAPPLVERPMDELSDTLQRLELRARVRALEDGRSEVAIRFRWRVSRLGWLSLVPLASFVTTAWAFYGAIGVAVVVAAFVFLHWPRDVHTRRLELVAKLSDALGSVLESGASSAPYR